MNFPQYIVAVNGDHRPAEDATHVQNIIRGVKGRHGTADGVEVYQILSHRTVTRNFVGDK